MTDRRKTTGPGAIVPDRPSEIQRRQSATLTPALLDRIELHKCASEAGLDNKLIIERLKAIISGPNDAATLRAIEVTERMVREGEKQETNRTTINGNVTFSQNFVALEAALEGVDPDKRREILDAVSGPIEPDESASPIFED